MNEPKVNYQRKLDELLKTIEGTPKLLLHSCCAPCSSYCLVYLSQYFSITDLYYNPNISPKEEFDKRAEEQRRLIAELPVKNFVTLIVDEYDPEEFFGAVKGLEQCAEGGERCFVCYRLRLERAAKYAATMSISPLKDSQKLIEIGAELSDIYGVKSLPNDFKKKGGYLRSIELSREYGLYRQNYCGCVFSRNKEVK